MPLIQYEQWSPRAATLDTIERANQIIAAYQEQGFDLTVRQLYYQFVARDWIENSERSYKNMVKVIDRGRKAGLIDWEAIVDRTRNLRANPHWDHAAEIIRSAANQFRFDLWADQSYQVEVWIEKDALIGVIEDICRQWDVPFFACRGYNSQSEQWRAGRRFREAERAGKVPVVLHLGDHDPSGLDMTDDNESRLRVFAETDVAVQRIALNRNQIDRFNPPPNPAKMEDSRAKDYVRLHGGESWELDALEPQVIVDLIDSAISQIVDIKKWEARLAEQQTARGELREIAQRYEEGEL